MTSEDWITPPTADPLDGTEQFIGLSRSVRDFWAFAMPDLRMNNVRGYLAEHLVSRAVGSTSPRIEWDTYDVLTPSGIRIEVKSSAYLQNWKQRQLSTISFGGLKSRIYVDGAPDPEKTYNADVYVFAVHTAQDHDTYSPLDVAAWTFYVLSKEALASTGQASLRLSALTALGARPLTFAELGPAVEAAGSGSQPVQQSARIRIATWNCAAAFREKVDRALALDADVYVIQEAEAPEKYLHLLPAGTSTHYEVRPEFPKGVLVFTRPGLKLAPRSAMSPGFAHVIPLEVTTPGGSQFDLWAIWTLDAHPKEAAYIGQAHLGLDAHELGLRPGTVMIGDYNSNAIWDHERRRNHSVLVERLAERKLVSAYHHWTGEKQGHESQATFFLQRNAAKPFHIDHCFTDMEIVGVEVGTYAEWSGLKAAGGVSDHVPVIVDLTLRPR